MACAEVCPANFSEAPLDPGGVTFLNSTALTPPGSNYYLQRVHDVAAEDLRVDPPLVVSVPAEPDRVAVAACESAHICAQ